MGKMEMNKPIHKNKASVAILMAILAAALYGISSPVSKLLLVKIPPINCNMKCRVC